jgi:cyclopropane-fatty-acyl-phospholipid synthase
VVTALLGGALPVALRCWDGSTLGPQDSPCTVVVRSPRALRRLVWAPHELGLGRAYVAGELDVEGDLFAAFAALRDTLAGHDEQAGLGLGARDWARTVAAAARVGALGPPPPPPREEARLRGRLHSPGRDAAAVSHHYDVGNDFYRLVLGPSLTYSCAYFTAPTNTLEQAQEAKYGLIAAKLGLAPGMRLLDVGCGWGGMVIHAALRHGVTAVGVTLSNEQAALARRRVAEAGLEGRVDIRVQDYRAVGDGPFDAISSIGMFEHVGLARLHHYFAALHRLLRRGGRLLNHAISRPSGRPRFERHSFIQHYVFPDGELHEVGSVVSGMQDLGFEVRDVESLREHYALTLRRWVANLEAGWDRAQALAGPARARIWRLYMAASALNFEAGRTSVHQILGVRPELDGGSGMSLTRSDWLAGAPAPLANTGQVGAGANR